MRKALMWASAFVLAVAFTGCMSPEEKAKYEAEKKTAWDQLNGKWKVVSREGDKDEDADPDADATKAGFYYIIENEVMRSVMIDNAGKEEVLDRQLLRITWNKDPKTVDLVACDEKGKPITTRTTKKGLTGKRKTTTSEIKDVGVYKVEGDTLTICASYDDKRPTDFSAPARSARYLLKLERVKDGSKKEEEKKDDKKDEKKDEKKDDKKDEKKDDKKGK